MNNILSPFHLAIPVGGLEVTRKFYGDMMGFKEGRSTENWIDWDMFGHQLSTHVKPDETDIVTGNMVDGKKVPCRHFGVVLKWDEWHELKNKILSQNIFDSINFIIEPYVRFKGEIGEQATMFFLDPSNNALEFKSFKDESQLFTPYE